MAITMTRREPGNKGPYDHFHTIVKEYCDALIKDDRGTLIRLSRRVTLLLNKYRSEKIFDSDLQSVITCYNCSRISHSAGKDIEAIEWMIKSRDLYNISKCDNTKVIFNILITLCQLLEGKNKDIEFDDYLTEAFELYNKTKDPTMGAKCYLLSGHRYHDQKNYRKALDNYEEARVLAEQSNEPDIYCLIHHDMGTSHQAQDDYSKALSHFRKAYEYSIKHDLGLHKDVSCIIELGDCTLLLEMLDIAEEWYKKALECAQESDDGLQEGIALRSLGYVEGLSGNTNDAVAHFEQAYMVFNCLSPKGAIEKELVKKEVIKTDKIIAVVQHLLTIEA
jgi:tetratricopeptide (TPR) repeat protein